MTWKQKELKHKGQENMRHNYWRIVGVVLIVSFVISGFHLDLDFGSSVTAYKRAQLETKSLMEGGGSRFGNQTSIQVISDFVEESANQEDFYAFAEKHYKPTNGILASMYNQAIGAKSFGLGMLNGINSIVFKNRVSEGFVIIFAAFVMLLIWIFIGTPLMVGKARYMIETRAYYDTKIGRIMFPWRVQRAKHVAFVMVVKQVYYYIWCLTVVGAFTKYYAYKLVPYILAEDPDISCKDAIKLSEDMMQGNKWKTFLMDVSFIGWYVLNIFTFGLLEWAWIIPYREATYAELYMELREEAKAKNTENAQLLFNQYLDVAPQDGTYPIEKYVFSTRVSAVWKKLKLDYNRDYSVYSLILLFFTFSFMGWVWEVLLHVYEDGMFVNRGVMHGPWLPIYGCGGVLVIVLLRKFADRTALTFALTVIVCGILEYATATFLWETKHEMWWEYTGYFLNLKGRICAEGLLLFGIGGMAFIYIIGPFFDNIFRKIPPNKMVAICCILAVFFGADVIYSSIKPNTGAGITDYKNVTEVSRIVNYDKLKT